MPMKDRSNMIFNPPICKNNEMKKIIEDMVKVADEKMYHDKQNKKQHISDAMM